MGSRYEPEWFVTPFEHIRYTLCRTKKQVKKLKLNPHQTNAHASVAFYDSEDGATLAVVLLPRNQQEAIANYALILHEAVHIFQELKALMNENIPSKEFEAFSIQRIAQDLFHLFN
ncbi:hypothetical protein [Acinetobacter dispersus]|uniref:hypothetical protein n=1 Tax=Acinetobacter dispersus TaxID=70348 RepID=UPI001F4AFBB2|nr:hypothetical protein [Acinetobacter dispersus]MCH7391821.1 hypothetical protein [Acinetobacter dispersus]